MGLDFTKLLDALAPRSRAWNLSTDGPLKLFFDGLAEAPRLSGVTLASILSEMVPSITSQLHRWSTLFGSPIDFDAEELAAAWGQFGGQHPQFIQDTLQALGVNVWVHEAWDKSTSPSTLRSPISYLDDSLVLTNDIRYVDKNWTYQFCEIDAVGSSQFGDGSQFGSFDGYIYKRKQYECPDDSDQFWVYWYVCGETFPDFASVTRAKYEKLIRLIFKLKPLWSRVVLRVNVVEDEEGIEIQNVSSATDTEIQNVTTETDPEIKNVIYPTWGDEL